MSENDYIELQNLLTKLRVILLKEISDSNLKMKYRDKNLKMVRSIDNLRKNTPLIIKTNELDKGENKV